jgi:hypothetical protein
MPRPPVDPWHSPAAIAALTARKLAVTREAWLKMLAGALEQQGTQGRAAEALGLSLRQFARWVAWLREHDAAAVAKLPAMPEGGYHRAEPSAAAPARPAPRKPRR